MESSEILSFNKPKSAQILGDKLKQLDGVEKAEILTGMLS